MKHDPEAQTISDFGAQWTSFTSNRGHYASQELFRDICGPDFDIHELEAARVLDVGSGTGRIVRMILEAGASEVIAVEPSEAFEVLKENTDDLADRITYQNVRGEDLSASDVDVAISFGVLHHIPDPDPAVKRIRDALRPGGSCVIWLYGHEGNELYLSIISPLRSMTQRLPDFILSGTCHVCNVILAPYVYLCAVLPLPMRDYMRNHFGKLGWRERFLTIFDQLNPAYAKYYRRQEAIDLLARAGFTDINPYHRHGYSWTIVARKPVDVAR